MGRSRAVARAAVLAGLVLVVHGVSLSGPFQYDDHHSVANNAAIADLSNAGRFFLDPTLFSEDDERGMYRPLVLLSYALTSVVDDGPAALRLGNLALHILVCWLLAQLGGAVANRHAGWWAAALFAVHPLTMEPAVYISARSESLALAAGLAAILLYRDGRTRSSLVLYGVALLAKSTAIVIPGLIICFERIRASRSEPLRLGGYGLVGAGYLIGVSGLLRTSMEPGRVRGYGEQLLAQLEAWAYQAHLILVPGHLSVEHPVPTSLQAGWTDLAVGATALSLLWLLWQNQPSRWWAAAAVLPLVPASVVPLNAVVSEHRLYTTMAVLCLAVVVLPGRVRWRQAAAGASIALLATITWQQQERWSSEVALWTAALEVAPGNTRALFFLGDVHRRAGNSPAALRVLSRADSLTQGRDVQIRTYRAGLLLEQGQHAEAARLLEPLMAGEPSAAVLHNLGLAVRAQDPARAEDLFRRALAADPDWIEAAMQLALLEDERGATDAAIGTLTSALQRRSDWSEAWLNLGFFQVRQRDFAAARQSWERALALDPGLQVARDNLRRLDMIESRDETATP